MLTGPGLKAAAMIPGECTAITVSCLLRLTSQFTALIPGTFVVTLVKFVLL